MERAARRRGFWRGIFAGCIFTLIGASQAFADHKVYSPIVNKGEWEFETRHHWTVDKTRARDDEQGHLFELGYGVTDWWATAIFATLDKEAQNGTRYGETAWENVFQLTPQGKYWLDAGAYLEYAHAARGGEADDVEAKLLLEKDFGLFTHTANIIFEKQVGEHREPGTELGYAWQSRWRWSREFQPGIEAYGGFGVIRDFEHRADQTHQVGPVFLGKLGRIEYEVGWLFGLTHETPNNTIILTLEYEFFM